jgi:long-chain acyl-CoA synthetase
MGKLRDLITGVLALDSAGEAVEFERTWTTWGGLAEGMAELAHVLASHGLGAGARVGVMMRNRPPLLAAMLEIVTSDRCLVTINPIYPDDKASADVTKSACPAIVAMADDWARGSLTAAARECGALLIEARYSPDGAVHFSETFAPAPALWEKPLAHGIAIEMLTSGTTGTPKRIPLAASSFERSMLDYTLYEKGREDLLPKLRSGVQLLTGPLAHIGGIGGAMNTIMAGRKGALLEKFTVANFHDLVVRHRPKVAGGPPTVLRMLLDAKIPKEDLASMVVFRTGTAPLDPALAEEFTATYGIPVLQNYGATEFAGGVAGWTNADHQKYAKEKSGSVGRLNPGVDGQIVDPETFAVLEPGEIGVLELRASHFGDGKSWIRTTDLAVLDADGFLFIRGRSDNSINRGGYKISPDDVVRALECHPSVAAASVVGIADTRLGQVPVAALVVIAGTQSVSDGDLKEFLRETLSPYQIPVQFRWVEELPLTQSLKVDQGAVRAIFQTGNQVA